VKPLRTGLFEIVKSGMGLVIVGPAPSLTYSIPIQRSDRYLDKLGQIFRSRNGLCEYLSWPIIE
jgi:hypothetical protein